MSETALDEFSLPVTGDSSTLPAKKKRAKNPNAIPKINRDVAAYVLKEGFLKPGPESPICVKCKLGSCGSKSPYLPPTGGGENPLITFVFDAPSRKEDDAGAMGSEGPSLFMLKMIKDISKGEFDLDKIRFASTTRCAIIYGKGKAATGGKWCRNYLVDDFRANRPSLIVPIGSVALGLLSHKSNAQDWGGKLLTWRGWPDDFLIDKKFENGHYALGSRPTPEERIPMMPLQNPRIIYGSRNPRAIAQWKKQLQKVLEISKSCPPALVYDRPWWNLSTDPDEIANFLLEIIGRPGIVLTFDIETTGLKPWLGDKIVFMMFRYTDPDTGQPRSIGFPWDYRKGSTPIESECPWDEQDSPLLGVLDQLAPFVLKALSVSKVRGHNITFDLLFAIGTIPGGEGLLDKLCEALHEDTWHMTYALRQEPGSAGLDIVAYDWAPDIAGYEEDMTLLISRYPERLKPSNGGRGHYANLPQEMWEESGFKSYVMGDVESCHTAAENIGEKLKNAKTYRIPLAHPTTRGKFYLFTPPGRQFVYERILRPASQVLAKMMARGAHIDPDELRNQETLFPKLINEAKQKLVDHDPNLKQWHAAQEAADPAWEFDLSKPEVLKNALFNVMGLPVRSLTDAGARVFKSLDGVPKEQLVKYASTDKFSVNSLAVDFPQIRPLLEYRSLHKQYTSYIRPMRNISTPGIDKNPRTDYPMLNNDGRVHPNFKIPGTRTGRLSCCIPVDEAVTLSRGEVQFGEVKVGDFIDTYAGFRRVTHVFDRVVKKAVRITLENGTELRCSLDHKWYYRSSKQQAGGSIPASDFEVGSFLYSAGKRSSAMISSEVRISKIEEIGDLEMMDITVDEVHSFLVKGIITSNSSPNLQQLPRDGLIKALYTSRFGKQRGCIYQADLSQIELRLLADACGDPMMCKAYIDGLDLHSLTTSSVFKIPYEHFSEEYEIWLQKNDKAKEAKYLKGRRKIGKTLNFLTGYGGGALGFQSALALQGVYIQLEEAEQHLDAFFETYPYLKVHIGHYKNFVQQHGCAVSLTGRVRILEDVFSDDPVRSNKALRAGYNHLIQASGSDCMLILLVAIEHLMRMEGLQSMLFMTVHDSLAIDCLLEELPKVHEIVDSVMSNIPQVMELILGPNYDSSWLIVPLAGDSEVGRSYLHAVKIPKTSPDWDEIIHRMDQVGS